VHRLIESLLIHYNLLVFLFFLAQHFKPFFFSTGHLPTQYPKLSLKSWNTQTDAEHTNFSKLHNHFGLHNFALIRAITLNANVFASDPFFANQTTKILKFSCRKTSFYANQKIMRLFCRNFSRTLCNLVCNLFRPVWLTSHPLFTSRIRRSTLRVAYFCHHLVFYLLLVCCWYYTSHRVCLTRENNIHSLVSSRKQPTLLPQFRKLASGFCWYRQMTVFRSLIGFKSWTFSNYIE